MWQVIQSWAGPTILISLAVSVVGIIGAVLMILSMPEEHFVQSPAACAHSLSARRAIGLCIKNLLGLILVILGIVMMVTPGPGLISMLLGLSLLDLPGKHQLLHQGLRLKSVRHGMNWIRRKCGRTPLKFPRSCVRRKKRVPEEDEINL